MSRTKHQRPAKKKIKCFCGKKVCWLLHEKLGPTPSQKKKKKAEFKKKKDSVL